MGTDVGVRLGLYPHTDLFAMLAHPAAKFRYTPPGVVRGGPTLRGRLIESQPTLGLWVMSAADKGATVTAEQSEAPLWSRNLPPQLS
jgi:hypothetical protein